MTQTEWIVSVDDELKDHDEMFVGNVRDGLRLTRCKDCAYFRTHTGKFREQRFRKDGICKYHNYEQVMLDGFCSNAERGNDD